MIAYPMIKSNHLKGNYSRICSFHLRVSPISRISSLCKMIKTSAFSHPWRTKSHSSKEKTQRLTCSINLERNRKIHRALSIRQHLKAKIWIWETRGLCNLLNRQAKQIHLYLLHNLHSNWSKTAISLMSPFRNLQYNQVHLWVVDSRPWLKN